MAWVEINAATGATSATAPGSGDAQAGAGGQPVGNGGAGGSTFVTTTQGGAGLGGSAATGGAAGESGGAGGIADAGPPDAPCTAESNLEFCVRTRKNCGSAMAADNCGVVRTTNCGTCSALQICSGGGAPNVLRGLRRTSRKAAP